MKRTFTKPNHINSRILFIGLILFIFAQNSQAATITSKTTGGDWNNANAWVGEAVPSSADAVTINGPVNIPAGEIASCASMTIAQSKTVTNRGTLTILGSLSAANGSTTTTLTQYENSTLYLGGGASVKTLNATATGNTVFYNGTSPQPIKATTYNKLKLVNSIKTTSTALTVNDSLITDAQLNINPVSITINGNAIFNSTVNISGTCNIGGNATFNGNSTILNTLSITGDLIISNSFSTSSTLTVNGNTNIESTGTFTATGGDATTITLNGNVTINGTWDNLSYDSNYELNSNLTNNGVFNAGEGTYYFNNTSEIVSTTPISFTNVEINGTVHNNADLSAGFMAGAGSFENMSGATLSLTGDGASISPELIANTYTNTVNYTGANQTIKSSIYNTLNLLSSDTLITDGDITADYFSIDATTTLNLENHTLAITNSAISTDGGILTACTTSTPLPDNINWTGHVTYNSNSSQTVVNGTYANLHLTNGGTKTVIGTITPTNLEVANGTTLDMTNLVLPTATYSGTGTVLTQNTSSTPIPANKTWAYKINYNGTSAQTLVNGNYSKLVIDNAAGVSVADSASVTDSLAINTGKLLIIPVNKKLTATTITNNAGTSGIYIQSTPDAPTGTLIFNNIPSNPVAATVEMYAKAAATSNIDGVYGGYKWQYFGIPISYTSAAPTFNECYVRKYNEAGIGIGTLPTNYWISVLSNGALTSFTAYEITQATPRTITYKGNLVNTNYSSGKLAYTTGATYKGQHLIGNSYTAAINISDIEFGSANPSIIENTIYLYNTGSYTDWVSNGNSGTVAGSTPGQYTSIPVSLAGSDPDIPGQIPSMQAFLVKVNSDNSSATINIPYSSATTRNTTLQRAAKQTYPYTKFRVNGSRFEDKMWIFSNTNCSSVYDNGWDGYKILGSSKVPQIWSIEKDINLQINTKDNINNSTLGFRYGEDSIYTITVIHSDNNIYPKLYLIDLWDNSTTDISTSGTTVTFKANASTPMTRFKIVTALDITTANDELSSSATNIFNESNKLYIQHNESKNSILSIYDLNGRLLKTFSNIPVGNSVLESNLDGGDYIIKLKSTEKETTRKIAVFQ